MAYFRMGVDLFPNVDLPVITVTTTRSGASVEEMETGVTKIIEQAVNTIADFNIENAVRSSIVKLVGYPETVRALRDRFRPGGSVVLFGGMAKELPYPGSTIVTATNAAVSSRWITDAELEANSGLVKTMSVKPPMGTGRVRLIEIAGIDLQPCGGTHVRATGEIGSVRVTQIEKKGKQNRRVRLAFA